MSAAALLFSIQGNLFRFGGPILIFVGSIGTLSNLIIFAKNTLRKNPCAICFIGVNIVNLLNLHCGFIFITLLAGYDLDPSVSNIGFCRFRFYLFWVLGFLQPSYIILAAIDRTWITSRKIRTRNLSTRRLVTTSMIGLALFWMLFHIHAFIFSEIVQYGPSYFVCNLEPGVYTTIITYVAILTNRCLPVLLMTVFGYWTVKNVRQARRVRHNPGLRSTTVTAISRQNILRSKDKQLIQMLLVDIVSFIICKCPLTIMQIYLLVTQYNEKSMEQQIIEEAVISITAFIFYIETGISFYTNILVSKNFRSELKGTFLAICRRCHH